MDSFIRLYPIYFKINSRRVLRPIYFKWTSWHLWLLAIVFASIPVLAAWKPVVVSWPPLMPSWVLPTINVLGFLVSAAISLRLWFHFHFRALESHYHVYYVHNRERMRYFGGDHQYLRYCLFKDELNSGTYSGNIDDAIAFVDEELALDSSTPVSSHPFFAGAIALLFGVVGGSVGNWGAAVVMNVGFFLFVITAFAYLIIGASKTPVSRKKEFRRFLNWIKSEPPTVS
jgi:hypothetical protein